MEIETPVLLAHAIEDATDIFGISGGGGLNTQTPPSVRPWMRFNPDIRSCTVWNTIYFSFSAQYMGCDSVVGIATVWVERYAVRTQVGAKDCLFSSLVQTGPGANSASCTMGIGTLTRG